MTIGILLIMLFNYQNSFADICSPKKLFKDIDAVLDTGNCAELPIGTGKIVSIDRASSPTGIGHNYYLERISKEEFKVKLNLHFIENTIFRSDNTAKTQQIEKKVKECVEQINPHLIGANGEKFSIQVLSNSDIKDISLQKIKNVIAIDDDVQREHSKYYGLNSNCKTIAHELLHLMGLTDEYKETQNIQFFEKDCRTLGPEDSIMHDHIEATSSNDLYPDRVFVKYCICTDTAKCKTYSESEKDELTVCPEGYSDAQDFTKLTNEFHFDPKKRQSLRSVLYIVPITSAFSLISKPAEIIVLSVRKTLRPENSYLYPAQFRAITRPNCKKENSIYYGCSKDGYYRPIKWFGSCHDKPKQCNDPLEWLR